MPCPNAPQAPVRHPRTTPLQTFCLRFVNRDKWHDPAKFVCRARHAVPLLKEVISLRIAGFSSTGIPACANVTKCKL
jgi:hypothetical protein